MQLGCSPKELSEAKETKEQSTDQKLVFTFQRQSSLVPQKMHFKGERCDEWRLSGQRFSSWTRLVRVQARVRRVIYKMKNPNNKLNGRELLPKEIQDAEEDIICSAQ